MPESAESSSGPSPRRRLLAIAAAAVSCGLVAWLLSRTDSGALRGMISNAKPAPLAGAALAVCALPPLMAWRWQAVLAAQGAGRLPLRGLMRAVMAANLLNTVLPGKAGDLVKAAYVREHGGLARSIGGVLLERVVDVGVLGALGLAGYAVTGFRWGLWAGIALTGGAFAGVAVLRLLPVERLLPGKKLRGVAGELRSVGRDWSGRPALVAQTVAGSLLVWLCCGAVLALLAKAFGLPLTWAGAYAVFPLAVMAGLVPVTLGGLGTREAVMISLLAPAFMSRDGATVLSLGYTVFTYWLLAALSLPAVWSRVGRFFKAGGTGAPSGR